MRKLARLSLSGQIVGQGGAPTRQFQDWWQQLVLAVEGWLYPMRSVTVAELAALSAPSVDGLMVFVTDESGGPVPAFSYAGAWLRVTDRAVVS
jgi:hypothetical protein